MEPIIVLVGFLGAGKTTVLKHLIKKLLKESWDPFVILNDYETENKFKKIKYKLLKGQNKLTIKATSLGNSPPNTSRIELIDKKKKYPLLTQLELNKSVIINITH